MSISGLIEQYPYAGLFLLLFLGALGLPLPEDMTLVLCGFLIANDVVKPLPALLLIYVIMFGLDVAFFYAGRKYGAEIVNRRAFRKIISAQRLSVLEQKVKRWGVLLIILGRHVIVLRTQLLIATGVFKMSPPKFLAADAITIPVTMAIMIGMGYAGGSSLQIVKKDVTRIEHVVFLAVIALVVLYLLYRFIKYRRI